MIAHSKPHRFTNNVANAASFCFSFLRALRFAYDLAVMVADGHPHNVTITGPLRVTFLGPQLGPYSLPLPITHGRTYHCAHSFAFGVAFHDAYPQPHHSIPNFQPDARSHEVSFFFAKRVSHACSFCCPFDFTVGKPVWKPHGCSLAEPDASSHCGAYREPFGFTVGKPV